MMPGPAPKRTTRRPGKAWRLALLAALASGCADSIPPDNGVAEEVAGRNESASSAAIAPEQTTTPGEWRRQPDGALHFAAPGGEILLQLSCHGAGGMVIERFRSALAREPSLMAVKAGDAAARLATEEIETPRQGFRAVVSADHPLMKQLVAPSGVLSIEAGETHAIEVPMSGATAGLARACERREIGPGQAGNAG